MKTREQFVLLANVYRTEVRWRGWLLFLVMSVAFFGWLTLAGVIGRFLGHESSLVWMGILLFLLTILSLCLYQTKSQESLARKLELVCPSCSRPIQPTDLKLAIATQNCPYCGNRIYS